MISTSIFNIHNLHTWQWMCQDPFCITNNHQPRIIDNLEFVFRTPILRTQTTTNNELTPLSRSSIIIPSTIRHPALSRSLGESLDPSRINPDLFQTSREISISASNFNSISRTPLIFNLTLCPLSWNSYGTLCMHFSLYRNVSTPVIPCFAILPCLR